jgi:hypothetical protein
MKTLIIHPKDITTDFLYPIYEKLPQTTILSTGVDSEELINHVQASDRCILMGHGTPHGLLNMGSVIHPYRLFINTPEVNAILRNQKHNLYIWCNADLHIHEQSLYGFFTGMFISEVEEALAYGFYIPEPQLQSFIEESNNYFATSLGEILLTESSSTEIYKHIRNSYYNIVKDNPVAKFNWQKLYHR